MGHRCCHTHTEWLVTVIFQVRVKPDDLFESFLKHPHLLSHNLNVTLVPTVAQYHQDSVSLAQFASLVFIELSKAAADIGAAGPEKHLL